MPAKFGFASTVKAAASSANVATTRNQRDNAQPNRLSFKAQAAKAAAFSFKRLVPPPPRGVKFAPAAADSALLLLASRQLPPPVNVPHDDDSDTSPAGERSPIIPVRPLKLLYRQISSGGFGGIGGGDGPSSTARVPWRRWRRTFMLQLPLVKSFLDL